MVFCEGNEYIFCLVEGFGIDYCWNDGLMEFIFCIDSLGLYVVMVNMGCEVVVDIVVVDFVVLELDLGENIIIDLGDVICFNFIIGSSGEVVDY